MSLTQEEKQILDGIFSLMSADSQIGYIMSMVQYYRTITRNIKPQENDAWWGAFREVVEESEQTKSKVDDEGV
jgi:hypothetical protein